MALERRELSPCAPPMNAEQRVLRAGVYSPRAQVLTARVARLVFLDNGTPRLPLRGDGGPVGGNALPTARPSRVVTRYLTRQSPCGTMGVSSGLTARNPAPPPDGNTGAHNERTKEGSGS